MANELGKSVMHLLDLIDSHASIDPSSAIQAFLGTSIDDVREAARELRKLIVMRPARAAPTQGELGDAWISVEDRLPEQYQDVATIGPAYGDYAKGQYVAKATFCDGVFCNYDEGDEMYPPSHWMPIPAPPVAAFQAQAGNAKGGA